MLIERDVHDIAARLREIDAEYTLHYDMAKGRFELHGKDDALMTVFPYDRMDVRMVEYARKTRRERAVRLLEEIESANARAEESETRARDKRVEDILREGADRYYAEKRRTGAP